MKKILFAAVLFMLFMAISATAAEVPETVRIGINASSPASEVKLYAEGGIYTYAAFAENGEAGPYYLAESVNITVSESGTLVCNGEDAEEAEVDFFKGGEFIECAGKLYRGDIKLIAKADGILIVNVVGLEDYLYGVVGREMSEGFPLEALKAQAVAARNYAVMSMGRHSADGFDLCNGVHCQAYGAYDSEGEKIRRAVDETAGRLLLYKGQTVQCYYYSSNGGYSESSENVWVAELGYLKGKRDPYEDAAKIPNYNWSVTFTADEIKSTLAARGVNIGDITDVTVAGFSENNHVTELLITGTEGQKSYYKDNIRAALPKALNSTLFKVSKSGGTQNVKVLTANGIITVQMDEASVLTGEGRASAGGGGRTLSFTFTGSGWGHGVGMSQYGAMFMAEQGFDYEEILTFYFTDTEIN